MIPPDPRNDDNPPRPAHDDGADTTVAGSDRPEHPVTALVLADESGLLAELSPRAYIVTPRDGPAYHKARRVWNGAINKYPAAIVYAGDVADVQLCVRFARDNDVPFTVRSGGHSIPGRCVVDDGLVLDLSQMRGIRVDPVQRTVVAEAGCLLCDLDHATAPFKLAVPAGTVSHTGIAGLTLGGGYGWLARRFGMTIDNVLAMDVVLADGSFVIATPKSHPDLFWAMCGAGSNYGVVTAFTYSAQPVDHVLSFQFLYPFEAADAVAQGWFAMVDTVPRELSANAHFVTLPTGERFMSLSGCYLGDEDEGRRALIPIQALGDPDKQRINYIPFRVHQRGADTLAPHGKHYYIKAGTFGVMSQDVVQRAITVYKSSPKIPGTMTTLGFSHFGGAINDRKADETAFAYRSGTITMELITSWSLDTPPEQIDTIKAWCRRGYDEFRTEFRGVYNNFVEGFDDHTEEQMALVAYGPNLARLRMTKARYDPHNFFRGSINLPPSN